MRFMHFYLVHSIMSAFSSLVAIAGITILVAATIIALRLLRKRSGRGHLTVFDRLLDQVQGHRTEIFGNHRPPSYSIKARAELLAETRLRLRKEKSFFSERRELKTTAFTLIELILVIAVVTLVTLVVIPRLRPAVPRVKKLTCTNHLKQVGLFFTLFANDHGDKFPMEVSTNSGGSLEFVETPKVFRHFQALSNEMDNPKVLVCPTDNRRTPATNFTSDFSNSKISYFVGVDAQPTNSTMFLSGDRNITNGLGRNHGLLFLTTNQAVGWTKEIHGLSGNVGLADGSVQGVTSSSLLQMLHETGVATNRIAVP